MTKNKGRVVGLDVHPDSFAGAVVQGSDPASAVVSSTSTRVELEQLEHWALRHTSTEDTLVLEASGNAFAVAARLRAIGREVEILDSHRAGKVGKVYCANDRVDAVKIARIYLSALSPIVWQPDQKTLERREIFSAYQAVVKESTRARQQLRSMLNEHCVRLEKGFRLCHPQAIRRLLALREWTQARRHGSSYWLYVVTGCNGDEPSLLRVRDPFARLGKAAERLSVVKGFVLAGDAVEAAQERGKR